MTVLIRGLLKHKKAVIIITAVITAVCAALIIFNRINYDLTDYLPDDAESTRALALMKEEFPGALPNASVMINDVSIPEALEYKKRLAALSGVADVMWLDDVASLIQPTEFIDPSYLSAYYIDGAALFTLTIKEGEETETVNAVYEIIGEENSVSGEAVDTALTKEMAVSESGKAILILLPVILVILLLTSKSLIEPLLFLLTIGVSVLISMGTNTLTGSVSYITFSVSPILQLAVSLDYAIFLLAAYRRRLAEGNEWEAADIREEKAMTLAVKDSLPAVAAGALTTLFGFTALAFMKFGIGADLGLNLIKGVALSFITVIVFLPSLTLCCSKLLTKTAHKPLLPSIKGLGGAVRKAGYVVLPLMLLLIVPAFAASQHNEFLYGNGAENAQESRAGIDAEKIKEKFGSSIATVVLVPKGDTVKEKELSDTLGSIKNVTSVVGYAATVGGEIPEEYLDSETVKQFYSDNYARIIVYQNTPAEGSEAFAVTSEIRAAAKEAYGDSALTLGQTAVFYDMARVGESDSLKVNIIAVVAIFAVLLFTFKSISIPVILLAVIESAIWINLGIPYFQGFQLSYIGYLVISTVQLGATVDYAILLTTGYREAKKRLSTAQSPCTPWTAMGEALDRHFGSILISTAILAAAGLCLGMFTTNAVISGLGYLLARGTVLSFLSVMLFLPALLTLLDRVIDKTTLKDRAK